jgi:hypothetical protein
VTFARMSGVRGLWRSLVAHVTGGHGVAGSNPVSPTSDGLVSGPFRKVNEYLRDGLCHPDRLGDHYFAGVASPTRHRSGPQDNVIGVI